MVDKANILQKCAELKNAYELGLLGDITMPEDSHPDFTSVENRLAYFTLPMGLNYQRNSYELWKAALKTYVDVNVHYIFDIGRTRTAEEQSLRSALLKYKLALQPNKHIHTWKTISASIFNLYGSIENMFKENDFDFLKLQESIQYKNKKMFPYLSGPKIFNYWNFIISNPQYGQVNLMNKNFISIAPDTHVIKCSVLLGVITEDDAIKLTRDQIAEKWKEILEGTSITPIDMHAPLWFWSKNGFNYKLKIKD